MPNTPRRKEMGRKHAHIKHICKCGREIYGNAYYAHRQKCAAWLRARGLLE